MTAERATIAFTKVTLPYGWLGNMSPHPLTALGMKWRTAEALFQALRFKEHDQTRLLIAAQTSPMQAKMIAKANAVQMIVAPRSPVDVLNMDQVLRLKLEQHPSLYDQLLATSDALIVEDCTARQNESGLFWGAARVGNEWTGRNQLGRLWMELRDAHKTAGSNSRLRSSI